MTFSPALVSIIIFTIILIAVGFYYRNKKLPEDYFMAGRKVGKWRMVASIFTLLGAGEIVTLTAFAYLFGFSGVSLFFGFLAGALFAAFMIPKIREQSDDYKPYTITDYIRNFIGTRSEKIFIVLQLIAIGSLLLVQVVVGGLLLSTLTTLSYPVAVIIIGAVIAIYLSLGGFHSILLTDLIQMAGMLFLLILLLFTYNPAGASFSEIFSVTQNLIPAVDFIVLFIFGFFGVFSGADVYQRIFSAKSNKEARKGLVYIAFLITGFGFLMILLGLKIFTQFPDANPNDAFFTFLASDLTGGLIAILSLFIIASVFSSADTELFLSSILVRKLFGKKKEMTRLQGIILVWIIAIVVSLLAINFTNLVDIYFTLLYAFLITGPVMLARVFNRGNDTIAFSGMLISLILLPIFMINGWLVGLYPLILAIPPLLMFLVPAKKTNIV
ncbi:MAG: sodium:solute symporter family transporter [Candidatus Woesearchaeota archaeon]